MNVLIGCERLSFRYGLDRVLVRLGRGLFERGNRVTLLAAKCDAAVASHFAHRIIIVPPGRDAVSFDAATAQWLERTWDTHFKHEPPDAALIAGWPFLSSIPLLQSRVGCTVFEDTGAVPLDGFTGEAHEVQLTLRELRKKHLPEVSSIVAISDFIARTQSLPDNGGRAPVHVIRLAADLDEWPADRTGAVVRARALLERGRRLILNLGRWEPGGYKNSEAAWELMTRLHAAHPATVMLALGESREVAVPRACRDLVVPIGCPGDAELNELMAMCDMGVSLSRWEGFNLPLAAMAALGRPALALDVAAHPEVIGDRSHLCRDIVEMAAKASVLLETSDQSEKFAARGSPLPSGRGVGGEGAVAPQSGQKCQRSRQEHPSGLTTLLPGNGEMVQRSNQTPFSRNATLAPSPPAPLPGGRGVHVAESGSGNRARQSWPRIIDRHLALLSDGVRRARERRLEGEVVFLDVTHSARDPGNPGIVRVTRRLGRALQDLATVYFVIWDSLRGAYVFPTADEYRVLSSFHGPTAPADHPRSSNILAGRVEMSAVYDRHPNSRPLMILSEIRYARHQEQIVRYLRSLPRPTRSAIVFYDAIPVLHPELCSREIAGEHAGYMRGLAQFDEIVSISRWSLGTLEDFWKERAIPPAPVRVISLPGEFGHGRLAAPRPFDASRVDLLCVSTIEPRKNHKTLVDAFLRAQASRPDVAMTLTLVGHPYRGAEELSRWLAGVTAEHPNIRWLGIVSDERLRELYAETSFTVYPSLVEGYGLPIVESLWNARPVICHNEGAMAELIRPGGGVAVDVRDADALSRAIVELATNESRYTALSNAAVRRPIVTWTAYAKDVLMKLTQRAAAGVLSAPHPANILFPDSSVDPSMTDGERLALAALLQRIGPRVAVAAGGSAGVLSQLADAADMVFALGAEAASASNISELKGDPAVLLPVVLDELDDQNLSPDLVFVAEGAIDRWTVLLAYVPKKPLFVVVHGSQRPERQQSLIETAWEESPFVQQVNADLVPGRTVDGEPRGGLALVYLAPTPRTGDVVMATVSNI